MSKKISLSYHEKGGQIFRLARSNAIYLFLLLFFAAACFASPHFRSVSNITTLLSQSSIIGILAIGQTIVLITGGFDLSHGSFLALVSVLIAIVIPTSIFGAFLAAMVSLLALGFVNGFFVNKGISPFIVTLGMQGIARTLALWLANSKSISFKADISVFAYGSLFGIPYCVIIWAVLMAVFAFILNKTVPGRHIYAIGGNSESARLSGVNVEAVRYFAYCISAFCSFAAGVIYVSKLGVGMPDKAVGYEMDSIACAIIGGTSLFGGVGKLSGTLAGVLIYGIITNIQNLMGVSAYWQDVIKGLIILVAVYFNLVSNRRQRGA
ncbi:Sugar ABC transporter permease [Ruminococcaceae bacterium BL-6]|nr:Sugar ABC transporter permease [Ruminococcaceae bacterium BL-6]